VYTYSSSCFSVGLDPGFKDTTMRGSELVFSNQLHWNYTKKSANHGGIEIEK